MQLTIEVSEATCARCGARSHARPATLRSVAKAPHGADVATDAHGGLWVAQGAELPHGWMASPTHPEQRFCESCARALHAVIEDFTHPPAQPAAASTSNIPQRAPAQTSIPSRTVSAPSVRVAGSVSGPQHNHAVTLTPARAHGVATHPEHRVTTNSEIVQPPMVAPAPMVNSPVSVEGLPQYHEQPTVSPLAQVPKHSPLGVTK